MIRNEQDLEEVILFIAAVARERGYSPKDFTPVTETALRCDVAQGGRMYRMYSSLVNRPWIVRTFEMGTKLYQKCRGP